MKHDQVKDEKQKHEDDNSNHPSNDEASPEKIAGYVLYLLSEQRNRYYVDQEVYKCYRYSYEKQFVISGSYASIEPNTMMIKFFGASKLLI